MIFLLKISYSLKLREIKPHCRESERDMTHVVFALPSFKDMTGFCGPAAYTDELYIDTVLSQRTATFSRIFSLSVQSTYIYRVPQCMSLRRK